MNLSVNEKGRWFESNRGSHNGATILHPNTKVLDFQGLFVFLGVQNNPLSPLHLSLNLLDLNLRLYGGILSLYCSYGIIFLM